MALKIFLISTFLFLHGCSDSSVPPGRLLVRNTSEDKKFDIVEVSAGGRNFKLKPGDDALLPKGVTTIYFSREYSDHTKRYIVECPANPKKGVAMKLLDVHLNRIAGGCRTISFKK